MIPVVRESKSANLDRVVNAAVAAACVRLLNDGRPFVDIREDQLRGALYAELTARLPGRVRKERAVRLTAFQGAGPFDLLVDERPGGEVWGLAEVKWSYTTRDKIFEALWDAVKLALAQSEHGVRRGWLIVGAPVDGWRRTECADLFGEGVVDVATLWQRALLPPGPNGGRTIGEDLVRGGRGNVFTRAPAQLRVEPLASEALRRHGEEWLVRAAAVSATHGWIEAFAPAPRFPALINQRWLRENVPQMSEEEFGALLLRLWQKRWSEYDLLRRVWPLRRS